MKVKTYKYLVKEGFSNIWKQKLMSIATVSIVVASFIILGMFLFIILNANSLMNSISDEPDLSVFCELKLSDEEVEHVKTSLENNPDLSSISMVSVEEGLTDIRENMFAEHPELFETIEKNQDRIVPVKFDVKMVNPADSERVIQEIEQVEGVDKAESPLEVVNIIMNAQKWINIISAILLFVLCTISVLIVSNAIRLTVHARRREIGIMKCVGATNGFIRGPFIVEGTVLGLFGALIAYLIVGSLYTSLIDSITIAENIRFVHLNETMDLNLFSLSFGDVHVGMLMGCIFVILGLIMGILGSVISIRKYLDV